MSYGKKQVCRFAQTCFLYWEMKIMKQIINGSLYR